MTAKRVFGLVAFLLAFLLGIVAGRQSHAKRLVDTEVQLCRCGQMVDASFGDPMSSCPGDVP